MCHRIRECMRQGGLGPLGGEGKVVEADETYYGRKSGYVAATFKGRAAYRSRNGKSPAGKRTIVALVERGGNVRSFHVRVPIQYGAEDYFGQYRSRNTTAH